MATAERILIRGFQWDIARQVERLEVLQRLLPRYADWGYHELYLHLEDAVHFPSFPGIGRSDAYTHSQLGALVESATRVGIRVVPIVNLLGHTQYLIKHPDLRDLNELRDQEGNPLPQGQICPLHPRTLEVASGLLRDVAPFCTAGKVHVGLDESFHLAKCPRCRAEAAEKGLGGHFVAHVRRLHGICTGMNLQMGMWADMLYFFPEVIAELPPGMAAYDWYYYAFPRLPRFEFHNFTERDIATPLRKQGVDYYGCPMNGAFRYEPMPVFGDRLANIRSWWRRCQEFKASGFVNTSWEAYRLALETTTVVDAATASLWTEPVSTDSSTMLAAGLSRALGVRQPQVAARRLLNADQYAFAGYARWQINDRWDVCAAESLITSYEKEARYFVRLEEFATENAWPLPLLASVRFRKYLSARDLFVRSNARHVFRMRRLLAKGDIPGVNATITMLLDRSEDFRSALKSGRKACRAMWERTRGAGIQGQNDRILAQDGERLEKWQEWLRVAADNNELLRTASPVCGAWQLHFWVHNHSPAVQKVFVEEQLEDGNWKELASRYTHEFRNYAALPKTKIRRDFSVPVDGVYKPLRIAIRGVGQVAISHIELTDGVTTKHPVNWRETQPLGRPCTTAGWPDFDMQRNEDSLNLEFVGK